MFWEIWKRSLRYYLGLIYIYIYIYVYIHIVFNVFFGVVAIRLWIYHGYQPDLLG